jgi:very-long-chain enoyl-CoA reductase
MTFGQLYVTRQKISSEATGKGLNDTSTLEEAGVVDGATLYVKDLGPQVSWRTVFLVEYVRPSNSFSACFHCIQC